MPSFPFTLAKKIAILFLKYLFIIYRMIHYACRCFELSIAGAWCKRYYKFIYVSLQKGEKEEEEREKNWGNWPTRQVQLIKKRQIAKDLFICTFISQKATVHDFMNKKMWKNWNNDISLRFNREWSDDFNCFSFFCINNIDDLNYTYPFCVNCIGTSILCDDERRRSPAMSASRAKSVSRSWSAKRGERRDSDKRTSSNFLTNSNGVWKWEYKRKKIISINGIITS